LPGCSCWACRSGRPRPRSTRRARPLPDGFLRPFEDVVRRNDLHRIEADRDVVDHLVFLEHLGRQLGVVGHRRRLIRQQPLAQVVAVARHEHVLHVAHVEILADHAVDVVERQFGKPFADIVAEIADPVVLAVDGICWGIQYWSLDAAGLPGVAIELKDRGADSNSTG
jgi:hypothetical protein